MKNFKLINKIIRIISNWLMNMMRNNNKMTMTNNKKKRTKISKKVQMMQEFMVNNQMNRTCNLMKISKLMMTLNFPISNSPNLIHKITSKMNQINTLMIILINFVKYNYRTTRNKKKN